MGCTASSPTTIPEQKTSPANNNNIETNNKPSEPATTTTTKSDELNFKPIHSAVRWNKDTADVEKLLVSTEAVNCIDPNNGNRAIHIAAQNGHDNLVELLIAKKAEINAVNMKGNSALHMAIGYDYYNTAQLLIAAGADLELKNEAGVPAKYGLEGDKALGIAALACANEPEEAARAFDLCEGELKNLNKVNYAQAGLKAKKTLQSDWSQDLQDRMKDIASRI